MFFESWEYLKVKVVAITLEHKFYNLFPSKDANVFLNSEVQFLRKWT